MNQDNNGGDSDDEQNKSSKDTSGIKHQKLMKRKNLDVFSENFEKLREKAAQDDGDDLLVLK